MCCCRCSFQCVHLSNLLGRGSGMWRFLISQLLHLSFRTLSAWLWALCQKQHGRCYGNGRRKGWRNSTRIWMNLQQLTLTICCWSDQSWRSHNSHCTHRWSRWWWSAGWGEWWRSASGCKWYPHKPTEQTSSPGTLILSCSRIDLFWRVSSQL